MEGMLNNIREYQLAEIRSIERKRFFKTERNGNITDGSFVGSEEFQFRSSLVR
jgi:hypothetical protein